MGKKTDTNFNTGYSGKNFYKDPNSGIQYYDSNNIIKDEDEEQNATFIEQKKSPFKRNASVDSTLLNSNSSSGANLNRNGSFIAPYSPRAPAPKSMREV